MFPDSTSLLVGNISLLPERGLFWTLVFYKRPAPPELLPVCCDAVYCPHGYELVIADSPSTSASISSRVFSSVTHTRKSFGRSE